MMSGATQKAEHMYLARPLRPVSRLIEFSNALYFLGSVVRVSSPKTAICWTIERIGDLAGSMCPMAAPTAWLDPLY
jgi:hypothetical protein